MRRILLLIIFAMAILPNTLVLGQDNFEAEVLFDASDFDFSFHGFFEINDMLWLNGSWEHEDHWYDLSTGEFYPTGMPSLSWRYAFSATEAQFAYEHWDSGLNSVVFTDMNTLAWGQLGDEELSVSHPQFVGEELWVHVYDLTLETTELCRLGEELELQDCEILAENIYQVVLSQTGQRAVVGVNLLPYNMQGQTIPQNLPRTRYYDNIDDIPANSLYSELDRGGFVASVQEPAMVIQILVELDKEAILVYDSWSMEKPYAIPQPQWAGETVYWNYNWGTSSILLSSTDVMVFWNHARAMEYLSDTDLVGAFYYPITKDGQGGSFMWNSDNSLWTADMNESSYVYNPEEKTITGLFEGELPEFDGQFLLTQFGQKILRYNVDDMEFFPREESFLYVGS
ncbi:MAG: hypothetical protein OEX81_05705 [Candidatus Pacebacteria bacterium]|nr:hypothetical protein [Candidatus Paceibacterota bacterium]